MLTGYRTDLAGGFEIAYYELGAGCGRTRSRLRDAFEATGRAMRRPPTACARLDEYVAGWQHWFVAL